VPSAAVMADVFAGEVDFFSIGTNDLIQYTFAVDRMNQRVSYLYQPLNPAVLRLVKHVIDAGHEKRIFTGMCGEAAGDEMAAIVLLGLGLDEFSMSPPSIPGIKRLIRSLTMEKAREVADEVLKMAATEEVEGYLRQVLESINRTGDQGHVC
jgi:phosphotransferase system enzyme I (PtsI)